MHTNLHNYSKSIVNKNFALVNVWRGILGRVMEKLMHVFVIGLVSTLLVFWVWLTPPGAQCVEDEAW